MRAIIFTVVIAAAAIVGFLVYRGAASRAPQQDLFSATSPAPSTPLRTNCTVENATYQYAENQAIRLSFRRAPSGANAGPEFANGASGRQIGNMMIVVHVTSFGKDYVFTPVNRTPSGPAYESYVLYFRPQSGGGAQMPVQLFDPEMGLIHDMPRNDSAAPGYIIMPDLMRRLYADHIDLATGAFRFLNCQPAQQSAPATP